MERTFTSEIVPDLSLGTHMPLRIVTIMVLALIPTWVGAQQIRGERQRTSEQEAQREARRDACREEAEIVYSGKRDRTREIMQQYVRNCMQRNR